nr:hypothetical protein [uncultured Cupriavidus sp.]
MLTNHCYQGDCCDMVHRLKQLSILIEQPLDFFGRKDAFSHHLAEVVHFPLDLFLEGQLAIRFPDRVDGPDFPLKFKGHAHELDHGLGIRVFAEDFRKLFSKFVHPGRIGTMGENLEAHQ